MRLSESEIKEYLYALSDSDKVTQIYDFYTFDNEMKLTSLNLYKYDISLQNLIRRNQHMFQDTEFAFDIGERKQDIMNRCKLLQMYDQIYVKNNYMLYEHTVFNYLYNNWTLVFMGYNHAMMYKDGQTVMIHKNLVG